MLFIKRIFYLLKFLRVFFCNRILYLSFVKFPSRDTLSNHLMCLRKYYPDDILVKTGSNLSAPESRTNHFLKFPIKKKSKTIRV